MSIFHLTTLAECDACPLEVADDDATPSGWTHIVERRGFDPELWEYSTYGDGDLHDASPREGTVRPFAR